MYAVPPLLSWVFLAGFTLALFAHLRATSRVEDASPHEDEPCPCRTDPNYHDWYALVLQMEDESFEQEDHR